MIDYRIMVLYLPLVVTWDQLTELNLAVPHHDGSYYDVGTIRQYTPRRKHQPQIYDKLQLLRSRYGCELATPNRRGVEPMDPGWKEVKVKTMSGVNITSAKVVFDGPFGWLRWEWLLEGGQFRVEVKIPPNTKGFVVLPSEREIGNNLGSCNQV